MATALPIDLERLLVTTKFAPPKIGAHYIERTHLLDVLRRGQQCRLTLVTGSAGFGKTVLLAQHRHELIRAGARVAWLSLYSDEKSLSNFRTHLLAAFGRLDVPLQDEMLFVGESNARLAETVAGLASGIATVNDDLHLFLDDYHHVEDPWAHKFVQALLDHGPANLHVIIASRALPPLSIGALRAQGQVTEVECGDLPFDLAETRAFLDQNIGGMTLGADEVRQIQDVTNGWPASLQLVSIMLKNRPERRATLHGLAWQSTDLQNYLSEDVVGHLPDDVAMFMESLSICRRFSASLAEAITGRADAATLIGRIEDENLLIARAELDQKSAWFRFHPLFNEFLSARLARRGGETVNTLHRRASAWFAERKLVIEAISHATLAGDIDAAVGIIERAVPGTWKLSYLGPLLHLIENVSPAAIAAQPRLLYLGSLTLAMAGPPARADEWAARLADHATGSDRALAFKLALVRATIALQRDDLTLCLDLLAPFAAEDAEESFERSVYLMVRSLSLAVMGDVAGALDLLDRNPPPPEDANDDMALRVSGCRSTTLLLAGEILAADAICTPIYQRALAAHGRSSTCATLTAAALASIRYERDDIDDARELLANRQNNLQTSSPQMMIWAILCEARLNLLQESCEAARDLLARAAARFQSLALDRPLAHILAEQARVAIIAGHSDDAAECVDQLKALAGKASATGENGGVAEIMLLAELAEIRLALHRGSARTALALADRAQARVAPLGHRRMGITLRLLAALALAADGQPDDAVARLTETVRLGAELGLVRTFVDEGRPLLALLQRLADAPDTDPALRAPLAALIAHFHGPDDTADPNAGDARAKTLLTARELQILELVAAGMSNKRIALTLGITVETVKWNLKNIFAKLHVSSRYDAMVWARRQNLIA